MRVVDLGTQYDVIGYLETIDEVFKGRNNVDLTCQTCLTFKV